VEIIVRYKNGSLYRKDAKEWITLEDVRRMKPGSYSVIASNTKADITDEVMFLAEVDYVRRKGLWRTATVVVKG
jgi:polyhydroxyalkanoate synthesis regulator protein